MIELTDRDGERFFVSASSVELVEPCSYTSNMLQSVVCAAGQVRKCRQSPAAVRALIDAASTTYVEAPCSASTVSPVDERYVVWCELSGRHEGPHRGSIPQDGLPPATVGWRDSAAVTP